MHCRELLETGELDEDIEARYTVRLLIDVVMSEPAPLKAMSANCVKT